MPEHFLGLEGARAIQTKHFLATQAAVDDVLALQSMAAIHGEAGLGKTFAVTYAFEHAAIERCWAEFPAKATTKQVVQELLFRITGARLTDTRYELQHDLIEILGEKDRLIVVDEAQRLNHECIEFLRFLHDDVRTRFALVLVGGNGCWEVLSAEPMLRSRITRPVAFAPLTLDEVLEVLPVFHPIYENLDPEVIEYVDDMCAQGSFRAWASFTQAAQSVLARGGKGELSLDVANQALAVVGS